MGAENSNMSETWGPIISLVQGRVRRPPWKLSRLCMKSYFDACLAPIVTKCLNTIFILSTYEDVCDMQQEKLAVRREYLISHLEKNCTKMFKKSLLHVSILVNDYEITNRLLHIFPNIHSNLLELAFKEWCDTEIIMRLISAGQDVNCVLKKVEWYVETPLHRACYLNDYDMVELLLRHGARLEPEEKYQVLTDAARYSDASIMCLLMGHLTGIERKEMLNQVQTDIGEISPYTEAILSSNWENLIVLVESVPDTWLNLQSSDFIELALSIITKVLKPYEQIEWLNQMWDNTNFNMEMLESEIYNRRHGKDSLLFWAIEHNNDPVVECIVRNHLHRMDIVSLQTALQAAVQGRCRANVINNILEYLPETDRCDLHTIQRLYRPTRALQHRHGFTALHVAADLGITAHFKALLDIHGAQTLLFEDNSSTVMSPLALAAKHPCLWPVFTQKSISREIDRRGFNLTELAHRYDMFPSTDLLCIPSIDFSESQQTWVNTEQAQAHVTQHFSQLLNRYQITPVWDSKSGETSQITTVVMEHLNKVSSLMEENYPFLAFDVILSGSSEENTKAIAPDELDFILPLTFLSMFTTVQNNSTTIPYVSVESNTSVRDMLNKHTLLNEQGILQMYDLFLLFRDVFTRYISFLKPPMEMCIYNDIIESGSMKKCYKPFMLKLQWLGKIYKNINIKVDIVPAIVITHPNKQSIATHVNNKIGNLNLSESNVYGVFKSDIFYPNQLRLSFSEHEAALIKRASVAARKGYTLAKCLRDSIICPKVQLPYSSEYMEAEQSVSTYVLKTCFIALLIERGAATFRDVEKVKGTKPKPDKNIISTTSITWAKMIYEKLKENLTRHGKVPHIFYEDWDVYFGKLYFKDLVSSPREQMLDDRRMSVTLQHCDIITNMLNTLHKDLQFSSTEDSNDIPLHYNIHQIMRSHKLRSVACFFLMCYFLFVINGMLNNL